jgi:hypothetical protein
MRHFSDFSEISGMIHTNMKSTSTQELNVEKEYKNYLNELSKNHRIATKNEMDYEIDAEYLSAPQRKKLTEEEI